MIKNSIGAACATVLVALAGGLATPTASHAAIYGGVFDPENDSYKWFGNHVFSIDDACLLSDGWKRVNTEYGYDGCGSAQLIGGDLTVLNKAAGVSRTIQFNSPSFPFIPTDPNQLYPDGFPLVWGVNIFGGQLVGVDTELIGAFTFDLPGDDLTHGGNWFLQWTSGRGEYCDLYCVPERPNGAGLGSLNALVGSMSATDPDPGAAAAFLTNSLLVSGTGSGQLPLQTTSISFQVVPEPTTVTLVLAALGAGWLTRRRKR